jgi:putative ABC transport system ATP-binding protein
MSLAGAAADTPLIRLEGVSKTYGAGDARIHALRAVTLTVQRGEFVGLTGPSGSGKSTLLNICGLLDAPDEGCYWFGRDATSALSQHVLTLLRREAIGFVFQGFNLVPVMSAYDNVEYPLFLGGVVPAARKQRVRAMLATVGLAQSAHRRPDELSGGQRQRVAIARALIKRPKLVIADEPTANLDSATAAQIIELMRELGSADGTTFLIATHDTRMVEHCTRVLALHDGALQ